MLDDVSQLSRVALLAVHAPRRSRQAALVALLKTLLPKINKHGAAKRTTGNLVAAKEFFVGKVLLDKKNKTIRNRTLWSFWELYNLFIGLLAGLAKGVGRFFVTVAFAFMAVARESISFRYPRG